VILAAIYLLWLIEKVFYGPITKEENKSVPEIAWNEVAALAPLIVLMVWIGVHPSTFLEKMSPSVKELISVVKSESREKTMIARAPHPPFGHLLPASGEKGNARELPVAPRSARNGGEFAPRSAHNAGELPLAPRSGERVAEGRVRGRDGGQR